MKQIKNGSIESLINTNDDDTHFTEVATKPIEMESKIYNVTAKEDGPTWGNNNRIESNISYFASTLNNDHY